MIRVYACLVVEQYRGQYVALHDIYCYAISRMSRLAAHGNAEQRRNHSFVVQQGIDH